MNKSPLILALLWSITLPVNGNPISRDKTRYPNPPANYYPPQTVDNRYTYENHQQPIGQMQYYPQQPCPQCVPMDLSNQYEFVPYENDPRSDPNAQYQYYPVNNYQNYESDQQTDCLECALLDQNEQQQPEITINNQNPQLQAPPEEVPPINQPLESNHKCPVCGSENTPMLRMYLFSLKPNGQQEKCQYGLVLNGKEDSNGIGQSGGDGLDLGQTNGSQDNIKHIQMATAAMIAPGTQNLNPNPDMTQLNPNLKTTPPIQNVNLNIEVYANSATTRISPKSTPSPIITTTEGPSSTTVTQVPTINSTTTTIKPVETTANNTEIVGSTRKLGKPSERSVNFGENVLPRIPKSHRVSLPRLRSSRSNLDSLVVHPNYSHTRTQGSGIH